METVDLEVQETSRELICVKAHLEKFMDDDIRVRVWWEVESNSEKPITILGYKFYFVVAVSYTHLRAHET